MLRLGMTNPPYILQSLEAIGECLRHPNMYAFVHIPVQSGSTRVLNAMKREYTCDEFEVMMLRDCDCDDVDVDGDCDCDCAV